MPVLATSVPPGRASHCYNGVSFTVCAAEADVLVTAIRVGGDLGSIRVFASREAGTSILVSKKRDWRCWVLVASQVLEPDWNEGRDIVLSTPVPVAAKTARCIYVHTTGARATVAFSVAELFFKFAG